MQKSEIDVLIGTREVEAIVGRKKRTLANWVAAGRFPAPIKVAPKSPPQWRKSEVEAWLRALPPAPEWTKGRDAEAAPPNT